MIRYDNGLVHECVALDMNTQRDFCEPNGACPVSNLDALRSGLRSMVAWTRRNHAPVVSCIDSHRPCEWPAVGIKPYCVDDSPGQQKIDFTIYPRSARVEMDNTLSVPLDLFKHYQQVIFRKRSDNLLENPKADRFLTQLRTDEFLVFGNTLECAVKSVVLGLLGREKHVTVVVDACGYWNRGSAELAMRQLTTKGAHLISLDELWSIRLKRLHRYPRIRPHDRPGRGDGSNGRNSGSASRRKDCNNT